MVYPTIHFEVSRKVCGVEAETIVARGTFELMHSKDNGAIFIDMLKKQFPEEVNSGTNRRPWITEVHSFKFWREEKQENKKIPWC